MIPADYKTSRQLMTRQDTLRVTIMHALKSLTNTADDTYLLLLVAYFNIFTTYGVSQWDTDYTFSGPET